MIPNLSKSFPARLSFLLILMTSAVFIVVFLAYFQSARVQVTNEAMLHAESTLENTILRIDQVLQSVEVAIENMAWNVDDYLDTPDSIYNLTSQLLKNNPIIVGSTVAFEPNYFPEKGVQYAPYSCYKQGEITNMQLGTEDYEYHYIDWYQIPKLLDKPYWSEPYFDEGGGEIVMSTFAKPLYTSEGEMYAIMTADISLEWLTKLVSSIKPYPNSYNLMIGRGATYLVHREIHRVLNETIFSATIGMEDQTVDEIGKAMVAGEKGMKTLQNDDTLSYVFYSPIERTGWSVGIVCPYVDVFASLEKMEITISIIFISGIILLLICCFHIVRKQTNPLIQFTASAKEIAQGNFKTILPDIRSRDEMRQLRDSFDFMQKSLVNYTEELKQTTANNERIESELRIASGIQMGMIPKVFPPFPHRKDIDLYASLIPAKEVGGDLYDYFIDDEKLYFTIGDVSGKGVPASLLMAVTRSLFRNMAVHLKEPSIIVKSLNDSIAETNESGMFVTLFLGVLDLKSGHLKYCNAGHNAPIIHYQGAGKFMDCISNIPLGLFDGFEYQGQEIMIESDTQLFLYTDGVTEAESVTKELYSDERLLDLFNAETPKDTPEAKVNQVLDDVHAHADNTEQSDDITIVCLHYKKV